MRISFALTKEYEVFIDKVELDRLYDGSVDRAVKAMLSDAEEIDSYVDDIEILDTELSSEDEAYEEELDDEYRRDMALQESLYLRDLI
ncbi:hypothetical protein NH288_05590 [Anaerococcus sp. NML200537]|uniref:hypothetical protein n=1 Tax=Anaerococcus sp. NML200537 TaxID=2954485 RepID=UPI002237DE9B|nr:hypothetical protein [Anaerococcus sp. NML200537]MCW6701556.1 hypothetical protein [Anaerococcus sp. NML200537]